MFVCTAMTLVVAALALSIITPISYLPIRWWGTGLNLTWLMPITSILDGVNYIFGSMFAIHIAVWWQCRKLHQSGWNRLAGLILGYAAVFWTLPLFSQWIAESFPADFAHATMPPGYQWLLLSHLVMTIPWYLIIISMVAPLVHLRSEDTLTGQVASDKQTQWSIRGLMLATALVAIAVLMQQVVHRMFSQHSIAPDTIYQPINQFVMLMMQASFYLSHCAVVCVALRSVNHAIAEWSFRKMTMNKTSIAGVVALALLTSTVEILSFYSASFSDLLLDVVSFVSMVLDSSCRQIGAYLTLYAVSVWVFRQWQQAGYQLELITAWRSRWMRLRRFDADTSETL